MKKHLGTILGVAAVVLVLAGVAGAALQARGRMKDAEVRSCIQSVLEDEKRVNTQPWHPPEDLLDLSAYVEIHWQRRALGTPCGPDQAISEEQYQGVVRLRPQDARKLAKDITNSAAARSSTVSPAPAVPTGIWPELAALVPADASWVHDPGYDDATVPTRSRALYVDPVRSIAFFTISDN